MRKRNQVVQFRGFPWEISPLPQGGIGGWRLATESWTSKTAQIRKRLWEPPPSSPRSWTVSTRNPPAVFSPPLSLCTDAGERQVKGIPRLLPQLQSQLLFIGHLQLCGRYVLEMTYLKYVYDIPGPCLSFTQHFSHWTGSASPRGTH